MIAQILAAHYEAARTSATRDWPCCVYARRVLEQVYAPEAVARAELADWHLWPGRSPWAPPEAAVASGIASRVVDLASYAPARGEALHVQLWRGAPFGPGVTGHTVILIALDNEGRGGGVLLDATETRGPATRLYALDALRREARGGIRGALLRPPREVA